jgi:hypothetical protein
MRVCSAIEVNPSGGGSQRDSETVQPAIDSCRPGTGLPDFSWHNIPTREKISQISKNYPKEA